MALTPLFLFPFLPLDNVVFVESSPYKVARLVVITVPKRLMFTEPHDINVGISISRMLQKLCNRLEMLFKAFGAEVQTQSKLSKKEKLSHEKVHHHTSPLSLVHASTL